MKKDERNEKSWKVENELHRSAAVDISLTRAVRHATPHGWSGTKRAAARSSVGTQSPLDHSMHECVYKR